MPLRLDASHPEADTVREIPPGPRAPEILHLCSGPYGLACSLPPICRTLRAGPPPVKPGSSGSRRQPQKIVNKVKNLNYIY